MKNTYNILILGGSGFIGRNLIPELLKDHRNYIINFDQNPHPEQFLEQNPRLVSFFGNFHETSALKACFDLYDINLVIHLISGLIPSSNQADFLHEINSVILPTYSLIELMSEYGVQKLLFFSSGGTIYGRTKMHKISEAEPLNPINFYGYSKLVLEKYLLLMHEKYNIDYLIIRPSNIYGIRNNWRRKQGVIHRFIYNVLYDQPLEIWGDGTIIRDFIFVQDLCDAVRLLIQERIKNKTLNIGYGYGVEINEIKDIVLSIFGNRTNCIYKETRNVDAPFNVLDISAIEKEISWKPIIDLREGIHITSEWMKKEIFREN